MIKNNKITIILPCKNEEKIIEKTINKIPNYVDEIIVVDNGSTDNSVQMALNAKAKVFVENRKVDGVGYGYAHLTGIKNSAGDFIVGMDADDTYPSSEIKNIVDYMEKNNLDVVSCNRLPLSNKKAISNTRKLGIYILNIEVLILYGYPIKDILTGMWVIRKSALSKLKLREGGWNLSPEVKISAIMNKEIRFGEYHINHFERDKEPSKQQIWETGVKHMIFIFKKRFTEDSLIGGLIYKLFLNNNWKKPRFSGQRLTFIL